MRRLDLARALEIVVKARDLGAGVAIVTVVATATLDSALVGSRCVVIEDGEVAGDIHPRIDNALIREARSALRDRRSRTRSYRLTEDSAVDVGVEGGDIDIYFEVLGLPPHLVIVGAGHIAVPLARMAKLLDFEVTVVDDRPEYGNRERFPDADRILLGAYRETLATVQMAGQTCVVLVTRGHVHDRECLEEVIESNVGYIGMIGSKRRVRTVLEYLRERGVSNDKLARVYAPIGLDIGSQSPAEIAVAVVAEIINVRNGGRALSLASGVRARV